MSKRMTEHVTARWLECIHDFAQYLLEKLRDHRFCLRGSWSSLLCRERVAGEEENVHATQEDHRGVVEKERSGADIESKPCAHKTA